MTRGTWHFSTDVEPDFVSLGGLQLVERSGDWSGRPFSGDAEMQLCISESD